MSIPQDVGIAAYRPPVQVPRDPPREDPPTDPTAPGLHPDHQVARGPNDFRLGIEGPDPDLAVGGSHDQQETQRDKLLALATLALGSYTTGHTPLTPRVPNDGQVEDVLATLNPNPPIGEDGDEVTHAVYQSEIPNATAQEGYDHFVQNPNEVFNAGGMEIRPPTDQLVDGGRYMLEIGTPVPTWLPVQISLDPNAHSIGIQTLDGHVLRGEQTFTFTDDGNGGTVLTQDARFQASSRLPEELQQITPIAAGQHEAWQNAHQEIYGEFNGDPGFQGIGTDFSPSALLDSWGQALGNIIRDPGNAADVGIDVVGELANFGIDGLGSGIDDAFDYLGIPGGDFVQGAFDSAGDLVSGAADAIGDGAEWVIDKIPFL
jgi:hypothetical protein